MTVEQLSYWFPAVTTTSLLAVVIWLTRSLLEARLKNSVKNEFDSKLETLRAELNAKESQIESLRSASMSGLMMRQSLLYKRRLEAIEEIWHSMKELETGKYLVVNMGIMKFEGLAKSTPTDAKYRDFVSTIAGNFDLNQLDLSGASRARPFLTEIAWAYYSAYQAVISSAYLKTQVLKIGVEDPEKYLDFQQVDTLLKTILPSRAEYIDSAGPSSHSKLLEEVEEILLLELNNIMEGNQTDAANTAKAAEIIKQVEALSEDNS